MHAVIPYVTAALLFGLGVYGVLRRRNAILVLMALELMLNAVNLIFVTADATAHPRLAGVQIEAWAQPARDTHSGGVFALFIVVLAAAEVGVGLAIVLQYYRMRAGVAVDDIALDPPAEPADPDPALTPVGAAGPGSSPGDPAVPGDAAAGHPGAGQQGAGHAGAVQSGTGHPGPGERTAG